MLLWSYDSTAPETVTQKSWFWNNNGAHAVGFRQDGKLWLLDGILESVSFGACGSHTIVWLFDPAPSYDAVLIEEL